MIKDIWIYLIKPVYESLPDWIQMPIVFLLGILGLIGITLLFGGIGIIFGKLRMRGLGKLFIAIGPFVIGGACFYFGIIMFFAAFEINNLLALIFPGLLFYGAFIFFKITLQLLGIVKSKDFE